jgi:hypothetical protein
MMPTRMAQFSVIFHATPQSNTDYSFPHGIGGGGFNISQSVLGAS